MLRVYPVFIFSPEFVVFVFWMTVFLWGKMEFQYGFDLNFRLLERSSIAQLYFFIWEHCAYFLCIYLRYRDNICKCTHTHTQSVYLCDDYAHALTCLRRCSPAVFETWSLLFSAVHAASQSVNFWDFPVSAFHLAWRADSHYRTSFSWALGISNSNSQTYMASTWPVNSLPSPCLFILIDLQYFSLVNRNCTLRYSV